VQRLHLAPFFPVVTWLLVHCTLTTLLAKHICASRSPSASAAPSSSRPNKRKQKSEVVSSDSEDSGFEKMAVDEPGLVTPDKSDLDATEDEDDDLDTTSPPKKSGIGNKGKVIETAKADTKPDEPPPRRELPFGKIGGRGQEKAAPPPIEADQEATGTSGGQAEEPGAEMDEDDVETSDDEL